jgi:hypothetical protein
MSDPRQGRAGQAGFSPRLARSSRGEPRLRANQMGALSNAGLDSKSIGSDGAGRQRVSAADQIKLLSGKKDPTILDIQEKLNEVLAALKGVQRPHRPRR